MALPWQEKAPKAPFSVYTLALFIRTSSYLNTTSLLMLCLCDHVCMYYSLSAVILT